MSRDFGRDIRFNDTEGDLSIGVEVRRLSARQAFELSETLAAWYAKQRGVAHKKSAQTNARIFREKGSVAK